MMRSVWTILLVLSLGAPSMAQSAGGSAGQAGANERVPPGGAGAENQSPAEVLRQQGGSLLRATLATQADAEKTAFEQASFFHVPPPEPRVIGKHDLVTIIIREESSAKSEGKTDLKKDAQLDARLEEFIKLAISNFELQGGGIGNPVPSVKASGNREFQGDGSTDRKDSFIARVQAEVIDVKPNGTLVLQARKRILTDEDEQTFVLSGICRAEDVTADNSVLSTQLFDLELTKRTKGPVRDSTKRGAIPRFLDWLNPF